MYSSNKYRTTVEGKYSMAVSVGRHKEERREIMNYRK
jgi:hypothetical protein